MPELPEVEEVRRTLEPCVMGKTVKRVQLLRADYLRHAAFSLDHLVGRQVMQTHRHGKKIFCRFNDAQTLVFHLGMTGRILCLPHGVSPGHHTHLILEFTSGFNLHFQDPRRFGGIWHYADAQEAFAEQISNRIGVDALQLTTKHLAGWTRRKTQLKAELLSQRTTAGLGNIYVDEALWFAKLHPMMRIDKISTDQRHKLVSSIRKVLQASIRFGGTTLRDYRNVAQQKGEFASRLRAYGRGGLPCHRCSHTLKTIKITGRTTVFCPSCQQRH
jgi:formamidopyrimidine-DNA glycosylase